MVRRFQAQAWTKSSNFILPPRAQLKKNLGWIVGVGLGPKWKYQSLQWAFSSKLDQLGWHYEAQQFAFFLPKSLIKCIRSIQPLWLFNKKKKRFLTSQKKLIQTRRTSFLFDNVFELNLGYNNSSLGHNPTNDRCLVPKTHPPHASKRFRKCVHW